MNSFNWSSWIRPAIRNLRPYSSARDEFSGEALVFLDANENPYENGFNRYPDPRQMLLRNRISDLLKLPVDSIFLGNGSDEAIDLLFRAGCEARNDRALAITPSYGMYSVCADIQGVGLDKVPLNDDFSLSSERLLEAATDSHKLLFLCSPNNPSGNLLSTEEIEKLLKGFRGVVVVDEAYIDFSTSEGLMRLLPQYPNLILLRTFSKAWGLAGVRCGMALGHPDLIRILMQIKYPYNLNQLTQQAVMDRLNAVDLVYEQVQEIRREREILVSELEGITGILQVYPSDANFVLVRVAQANEVYNKLVDRGLIIRNRSNQDLCEGALRITIGTPEENKQLIREIKTILQ